MRIVSSPHPTPGGRNPQPPRNSFLPMPLVPQLSAAHVLAPAATKAPIIAQNVSALRGSLLVRVRSQIIRNARIENVGKSQSCMVSTLRILWKQTVGKQGGGDQATTNRWWWSDWLWHTLPDAALQLALRPPDVAAQVIQTAQCADRK